MATVVLIIGALFTGLATYRLRQGERVTLILRLGGLAVPGLDRVIGWDDIADLDLTANHTGIVKRLLLPPEAPFLQRAPGGAASSSIRSAASSLQRKRNILWTYQ